MKNLNDETFKTFGAINISCKYLYSYIFINVKLQLSCTFLLKRMQILRKKSLRSEELFSEARHLYDGMTFYFSSLPRRGKTGIFSASALQISRHDSGMSRRARTTSFLRACVEC